MKKIRKIFICIFAMAFGALALGACAPLIENLGGNSTQGSSIESSKDNSEDNSSKDSNAEDSSQEIGHTHSFSALMESVEPTCVAEGYTIYGCVCGKTERRDSLPINTSNHVNMSAQQTVESTCVAEGYTLYECVCGKTERRDILPINASNHTNMSVQQMVEATCMAEGYTIYECVCGKTETRDSLPINASNHTNMSVQQMVEATCMAEGYTIYECVCGKTERRDILPINASNHTNMSAQQTIESTCMTEGYILYQCDCGASERKNPLPLDGSKHENMRMLSKVEPTCIDVGYTIYQCDCGQREQRDYQAALGHNYGEALEILAPTVSSLGVARKNCLGCNHYQDENIPAITAFLSYTVENGWDILTISFSAKAEMNVNLAAPVIIGTQVPNEEIDELRFGENVESIAGYSLGSYNRLKRAVFSDEIEKIGEKVFYPGEYLEEIIFEGDAPEVSEIAFMLNGGRVAVVKPPKDAEGFDGLIFGGQTLFRYDIPQAVPEMSLQEYAQKTAEKSVELTRDMVAMYKAKGQEALMTMPYLTDLDGYVEIKDFTLRLIKDCSTEQEKIDVIYDYIVDTIVYDDNAVSYDPYQVLKSSRAVCAGYVGLMHDMLAAVDIPSFYTRGMTLFGNPETVDNLVTKNEFEYIFDTHAWLTVYQSDGTISYYDPTWGVSNKEVYRNMDVDQLSAHAITFETDFVKVIIDELDYTLFGGTCIFLHDGYLYAAENGTLNLGGVAGNLNGWLCFGISVASGDEGEYNFNGTVQPDSTVWNNGATYSKWLNRYQFFLANGRAILFSHVLKYIHLENSRYGKEIDLGYESLFVDNGVVYFKRPDDTLSAVTYYGEETDITIPATLKGYPVRSIAEHFLEFNETVKRVTISEGIERVHTTAFYRCSSLEYIYLPSTVVCELANVGGNTVNYDVLFYECINLKEIAVSPNNPTMTSKDGNLYNKDMTVLIQYAANNDFTTFVLPESVTAIGEYAFNSAQLSYLTLHSSVHTISANAFNYSMLKEIVIPANCTIGHYAFAYCTNLRKLTIEEGITSFGEGVFKECQSLYEVTLPSTLTEIAPWAFAQCTNLYQMNLPEGLSVIRECAFFEAGLTTITLPSSLTSIESEAFDYCYSLYHINNLSALSFECGSMDCGLIAQYAKSISSVKDDSRIVVDNGFVFYLGEDGNYLTNIISDQTHTVLPETVRGESYQLSEYAFVASEQIAWNVLSYACQPWVNEYYNVGKYAESITIPNTITYIPAHCFTGWISLKTIYFDGTEEEWNRFVISNIGNAELLQAEVVFLR